MRVDPDDREPAGAGRKPADRTQVGAAAASENEGKRREVAALRRDLLLERLLLDHSGFGIRKFQPRGGGHRLASLAP